MQSLLNGLTQPRIYDDGKVITPNTFMLRAAKVIQETHLQRQQSHQALMTKQAECDMLFNELTNWRLLVASKEVDLTEYLEVMNNDRL